MKTDLVYITLLILSVLICGVVSWIGGYSAGKRVVEEQISLREKIAYKKGEREGIAWAKEELTRVCKK